MPYLSSVSPALTQTVNRTVRTIPASDFTVLSGAMTGNADGSISINTARLRALMNYPLPSISRINYHFRVLGSSPTINPDADGVIRQGLVLWTNVQNACNLYFLSCRTDSREAPGTTVIEVQSQINPLIIGPPSNVQLNSCAGQGYTLLSQLNGSQAKIVSAINIMDGNNHDFGIDILGPSRWRLYLDNTLVFEAFDPTISLAINSALYALRTDNVDAQLSFQVN